jgi:hypothetical protein
VTRVKSLTSAASSNLFPTKHSGNFIRNIPCSLLLAKKRIPLARVESLQRMTYCNLLAICLDNSSVAISRVKSNRSKTCSCRGTEHLRRSSSKNVNQISYIITKLKLTKLSSFMHTMFVIPARRSWTCIDIIVEFDHC